MRILLLAALIASPVMAEVAPRPVGPDPRIRSLAYDPDEVFRLDLAMKFITHIRFAPGEARCRCLQEGRRVRWSSENNCRRSIASPVPTPFSTH